jgi:hypothetical protein
VALPQESPAFMREEFDSLEGWQPLTFPKIEQHTQYDVVALGDGGRALRAQARGSASGLIRTNTFDATRLPVLRWRWKTDSVYRKGNAERKSGDDYPIRVYVVFTYDPDRAGFAMRAKYALARKLYGEYPPHSSLNYIWANRLHDRRILPSPYTGRSQMVVLRAGTRHVGTWVEEEVNVVEDYRAAFGEDPPPEARLAVMSDADNTGEAAVAYIDFIELLPAPAEDRVSAGAVP